MQPALLWKIRLALALDGQLILAGDEDFEVAKIKPRQLGFDVEGVGLFPNVDGGKRRKVQAGATIAPAVKEAIHFLLHLLKLIPNVAAKRIPAGREHKSSFVDRN